MSLPVTITGISTDTATVGPYQSSGGNFYFFGKDSTVGTTLQCYKATDPTVSWSSVATNTGFSTAIHDIAGNQKGDIVHLVICDGLNYSQFNYKYRTFDMGSESFVTSETIASSVNTNGVFDPALCSAVIRSSDEVVTFFQGNASGGNCAVYYSRRTGVDTWTAPVQVDGGSGQYLRPLAILGDSDEVQFLFGAGSTTYQRALNSGNTLQTATTLAGLYYCSEGLSFNLSGTTKCVAAGMFFPGVIYFDASDTPTLHYVALGGADLKPRSIRLCESNSVVYALYSKISGTNKDYYFRSSTDGGATWAAEVFICHSTNDGAIQNTSRFARLYPSLDDIIFPFIYTDAGSVKHNHKVVATTDVNLSISAATSSAAYASMAKKIDKSPDIASSVAIGVAVFGQAAKSIGAVSTAGTENALVAEGGDVSVNLESAVFYYGAGGLGIAKETTGAATRVSLTRLGPGGYPIATLPTAVAGPETDISIFSVTSGAAFGSLVECRSSFGLAVAVSPAAAGLSVWTNSKPAPDVLAAGRASALIAGVRTGSLASSISSGAEGQFNPTNLFWFVDVQVSATGQSGIGVPENSGVLSGIYSTAATGDFAPYAFTGTSVVLSSVATQVAADQLVALNESMLAAVSAYAAQNLIHMEGDEALSLAAAAAAGTVGDLLVAIVIPPAIQWLVCASIDIVPEVMGDLATNAELQATVVAAAALQGSPQIGVEVEGTLEIGPSVGGSPSMKEC